MRLICPVCSAQYEVAAQVLPPEGLNVECSACGQHWHQTAATLEDIFTGMNNAPVAPGDDHDTAQAPPAHPRYAIRHTNQDTSQDMAGAQERVRNRIATTTQHHIAPPARGADDDTTARIGDISDREYVDDDGADPGGTDDLLSRPISASVLNILRQEVAFEATARAADAPAPQSPKVAPDTATPGSTASDTPPRSTPDPDYMDWPATTVTDPLPDTAAPNDAAGRAQLPWTDPNWTSAAWPGVEIDPRPQVLRHIPVTRPSAKRSRLASIPPRCNHDIVGDHAMRRKSSLALQAETAPQALPDIEMLAATLIARYPDESSTDRRATDKIAPADQPVLPQPTPVAPTAGGQARYHAGMVLMLGLALALVAIYALAPLAGPDSTLAEMQAVVDGWRVALFERAAALVDALIDMSRG